LIQIPNKNYIKSHNIHESHKEKCFVHEWIGLPVAEKSYIIIVGPATMLLSVTPVLSLVTIRYTVPSMFFGSVTVLFASIGRNITVNPEAKAAYNCPVDEGDVNPRVTVWPGWALAGIDKEGLGVKGEAGLLDGHDLIKRLASVRTLLGPRGV
jgi:hypothetical protein